jgi:hypothetical protein
MFFLGIGMVMFFWFPALYERKYVVFDAIRVADPVGYLIKSSDVVLLGFAGILAACIAVFIRKPLKKEKTFFLVSFALTLLMVLPVSTFIWRSNVLAHIIQFPYRFLSLTVLIACWLVGFALEYQKPMFRFLLICIIAVISIWSSVLFLQKIEYTDFPEGYYTTNEATTTVHDEYMPRWAGEKPTERANQRLIFYQGAGTFEFRKISTQSIDVLVLATQDSIVQINTVYYPGWGATLDGAPVLIDYKNKYGVIRIPVPQGSHRLTAGFRETISRFLADNMSLGFLIWYGIAVLVRKRRT